jgi:hypothetical protein
VLPSPLGFGGLRQYREDDRFSGLMPFFCHLLIAKSSHARMSACGHHCADN